jgi:PAS domain S-box-containing protein
MTPNRIEPDPQRLAAIVRSTDDAVLALDVDGRITDWNEASEQLYGYSALEAVGQPVSLIVPPARREEDAEMLRRALLGKHITQFDTERLRRDGSRVAVSLTVSAMHDADGSIVGASTIARDITARREAEANRSQLAALVACSADAIIATDVGLRITACNDAAAELYRLPRELMLGRVSTEISESSLDRDARMALMRRALAGETVSKEGVHRRHDNSELALAATAAPVRMASGEIVGVVAIARDVTAEWQARAALVRDERRARMLADASRVLDRSLQTAHVVSSITRLVVPALADLCSVVAVDQDGDGAELVDVAALDPAVGDLVRGALERQALTERVRATSEPALHGGDDILLDPVPASLLADWAASYPELRAELVALTLWSVMIVPLRTAGRTLGLMFLLRASSPIGSRRRSRTRACSRRRNAPSRPPKPRRTSCGQRSGASPRPSRMLRSAWRSSRRATACRAGSTTRTPRSAS